MTQLLNAQGQPVSLTFDQYQRAADSTAIYPKELGLIYVTLGLVSEVGEIAGKLKKIIRDKAGQIGPDDRMDLIKEAGDVQWYLAELATELQASLADIAKLNIAKLMSRKERGTLQGSGDDR